MTAGLQDQESSKHSFASQSAQNNMHYNELPGDPLLEDLFLQLGKTLYWQTKDDEDMFLLAPSLYLAISKQIAPKEDK